MPGREPRCHCGFERTSASAPARSFAVPPSSPAGGRRRGAVLVAALAAGVIGVLLYAASRREPNLEAAPRTRSEPIRGEAIYPALPPLPPAARARPARAAKRPPARQTSASVELDLPLRRIAAETSVLELDYHRFADPCVAPPVDRAWLASLKTARLISGVTLREHGATVDCETARKTLVARADALKSDLDAARNLAQTSGVRPEHWQRLVATYLLEVWERY